MELAPRGSCSSLPALHAIEALSKAHKENPFTPDNHCTCCDVYFKFTFLESNADSINHTSTLIHNVILGHNYHSDPQMLGKLP